MKHEQIIESPVQAKEFFERLQDWIEKTKRHVKVSVTDELESKTQKQLGYYYSTVLPTIRKELESRGEMATLSELDCVIKFHAGYTHLVSFPNGEVKEMPMSKADMSKKQMSGLTDKSIIIAAQLYEVVVPPPKERENGK